MRLVPVCDLLISFSVLTLLFAIVDWISSDEVDSTKRFGLRMNPMTALQAEEEGIEVGPMRQAIQTHSKP